MRKGAIGLVATGIALSLFTSACSSDSGSGSGSTGGSSDGATKGKVGVILPDTQSSARWEAADKPFLEKAFAAAGVEVDVQNALGDKGKMATIADSMIQSGVSVLAIVNLDSATGAQIQDKAKQAGVKTIDYDRPTLGGTAEAYVSFDNVKVGELQGQGLVDCLEAANVTNPQIIELNGSPTDNNATQFKQGYDSVLDKKYAEGWKKVGDQSVPDWKNELAGTIFEQLLTANGNKVDGVLAANDGLGNAAITVLKKNNLQVPVTGQDATVQGLQNILAGDQCMTVYKSPKQEAQGLVDVAIALLAGETPKTTGEFEDTEGKRQVPALLLDPVLITKDNVNDVITDGGATVAEVCTADYKTACDAAGIK